MDVKTGARFAASLAPGLALMAVVGGGRPAAAQTALPTSNGFGAAVYDIAQRRLTDFLPAIYQSSAPGVRVPDLLFDAYFGLRTAAGVTWLTALPLDRIGYVPGTNLIEVEQHLDGRTIVTDLWAPWDYDAPAFALWVDVQGAQAGDRLVSLENLHVGRTIATGDVGAEETRPMGDGVIREAGDHFTVFHRPLVPPAGIAVPPPNPYVLAEAGQDFAPPEAAALAVTDDAVVGFEFAPDAAGHLVGGVLVVVVFMLVARPVTVFLCALPDRRAKWTFKEMLFMCWTRETCLYLSSLRITQPRLSQEARRSGGAYCPDR